MGLLLGLGLPAMQAIGLSGQPGEVRLLEFAFSIYKAHGLSVYAANVEPRDACASLPALLQRQRPVCARSVRLLALHSVRDHTTQVLLARSFNFDSRKGPVNVQWFIGAETNLAYNCLDRNVEAGHGDRVAFYWEGNDLGEDSVTTYSELLAQARPR